MLNKNEYYELPPKITIDNKNTACCCGFGVRFLPINPNSVAKSV